LKQKLHSRRRDSQLAAAVKEIGKNVTGVQGLASGDGVRAAGATAQLQLQQHPNQLRNTVAPAVCRAHDFLQVSGSNSLLIKTVRHWNPVFVFSLSISPKSTQQEALDSDGVGYVRAHGRPPGTSVSSQPRNEATLSFRASVAALHAANCVLGDINEET